MYARVTRFRGPAQSVEDALGVFREQMLPWLREATGFRGFVALLDREHDQALGITFWADERTMRDGTASGAAIRDEIARAAGTTLEEIDFYEVTAVEELALGDGT